MSTSKLPERASREYLKKLAKDRLQELRRTDPGAKLANALLSVARDHGFSSWRALKAELDRRHAASATAFVAACAGDDVDVVRALLASHPHLVKATDPAAPHAGWTGLHAAARHGSVALVRLLLEHGADVHAREAGDNTCPLHWAAARGDAEVVRALVDAGSDVHGVGDVHELDVIGWATVFHEPNQTWEALLLLLERGARHHIFSAIAFGDPAVIQSLVEQNPEALDRRLSRFENGQTALHYAITRKRYDILDLLIELGADLDAGDKNGRSALEVAMLRGDRESMRRLHDAGASSPPPVTASDFTDGMAKLAGSVKRGVPMIAVPDVGAALEWYASIGFTELARFADADEVTFGMVSFGGAQLMMTPESKPGTRDVRLWFYTDQVEPLYHLLKSRQLEAAQAALAGATADLGITFDEDLYEPFYGGRQFSIRDLNGFSLIFLAEK